MFYCLQAAEVEQCHAFFSVLRHSLFTWFNCKKYRGEFNAKENQIAVEERRKLLDFVNYEKKGEELTAFQIALVFAFELHEFNSHLTPKTGKNNASEKYRIIIQDFLLCLLSHFEQDLEEAKRNIERKLEF